MKPGAPLLAGRYARAYDGAAQNAAQAAENLKEYQAALNALGEAAVYIKNPVLPMAVKTKILDKALPKGIAAAFIKLLVAQKRFGLATVIERQLQDLLDKRLGIKRAAVTTALKPTANAALEEALSVYFGADIKANYTQDADLLGGLAIRQGDILIDASARGRAQQLQKILTGK